MIRALKMRKELRRLVSLNDKSEKKPDPVKDDDQNPFDEDFEVEGEEGDKDNEKS